MNSSSAVALTAMATARPSSLKRPPSGFSGTAEWMILNDCYGGFLGKLGFTRCAHFKYEEHKRCALFRCKWDPWNCSFAQTILLKTEDPEHLKNDLLLPWLKLWWWCVHRSCFVLFCWERKWRAEEPVFAEVTTLPHKFVLFSPPNLDHILFC